MISVYVRAWIVWEAVLLLSNENDQHKAVDGFFPWDLSFSGVRFGCLSMTKNLREIFTIEVLHPHFCSD